MSRDGMNGQIAKRNRRLFAAALLLTATSAGGCADLRRATSLPPVNPESPVAGAVAEAAPKNYPRPRLQDVPPAPRNVDTAPMVKAEVLGIVRCRRAILSYGRTHPPLSRGAEDYADDQRLIAQAGHADAPPPNAAALSEDLAARLRAFAAPPAALGSGPPPTPDLAKPPAAAPATLTPVSRAMRSAPPAPPATTSMARAPGPLAERAPPDRPVPPLPAPGADPLLASCT
jgi:hypothetical protein